jgi:hypothetical protein
MTNEERDRLLRLCTSQIDKVIRMCLDDDNGESADKSYLVNGLAVIRSVNDQMAEMLQDDQQS